MKNICVLLLMCCCLSPDTTVVAQDSQKPTFQAYSQSIEQTDEVIEMLPIPAGMFVMGSVAGEDGRKSDEGPQRNVTIDAFWMSKCEITWNQYDVWGENLDIARRKIFGQTPTEDDKVADSVTRPTPPYTDMSFGMGKLKNPAISMTQHAARKYCEWLSAKTGHYYRLPTEAEWEYACRAGTTTRFSFGDDESKLSEYAWHAGNSDETYHEVGLKKPNDWGLHDMHGNVAEWVLDQYLPDAYSKLAKENPLAAPTKLYPRVVRGGSWEQSATMLRSAAREASHEDWKQQDPQLPRSIWYHTDALGVGFRIVRPLVEPSKKERASKWDKTLPVQLDPVVE